MVRKSNRRSNRRDDRRSAILRAAAGIFRAQGFAGAGMRDIARAADLSAANLYHYFRGKDEILYFCQDRALDRMLDALAAARRSRQPADRRLLDVLTAHVRTLIDDVAGATAHVAVDALSPSRRSRIVAKRDRYERGIRRLVTDGVSTGALATDDPALVTRAMLGAVNATVTWFRPDGPATASDVGASMAAFLVRGLARQPNSRR